MSLFDLTKDTSMRLLVNPTRMRATLGPALAEAHRRVGAALAGVLAEGLLIEEYEIEHATGPSRGHRIASGNEPIVLAIMRAGLFVAEGIWGGLPGSALIPWSGGNSGALPWMPGGDRALIVSDSVVNTGSSLQPVLDAALKVRKGRIAVAAIVGFRPTAESLAREYPGVDFAFARLSEHSYVGRGSTDTGARLFGTTTWPVEK
jgi:uracil phosphoribosyltransferase